MSIEGELIQRLNEATDKVLFLSEVSRVLSAALTDKECFHHLLNLVVPRMADWATLNIVNERGEIQRAGACTADPKKRPILDAVVNQYSPRLDDVTGSGYVISHAESEFVPISRFEERLKEIGHPEWTETIKKLGIKSRITVPLKAHKTVLGALWLATSESGRIFTEHDLKLAEEIATRAASSAYHLMRYIRASRDIERLEIEMELREQYLSNLRHDILSVLTSAQLSAQLIQKTEDCDKKNDFARRIVEAINQVTDITRATKKASPRRFKKDAA
jgi:GAF domain-containing protein